jgi:ADP-ribose pyrophosphatase YjhB (NUDIX family)
MHGDMLSFVSSHPDCFLRSNLQGQVTGSAWILDMSKKFTLLVAHKKLNKWLQPGGHYENDPNILTVASREAAEETGLSSLVLLSEKIFDIDVHWIPAHKEVPEHRHFDIRFVFEADINEPLKISGESKSLAWIPLHQVAAYNPDESLMRMVRKSQVFQPKQKA